MAGALDKETISSASPAMLPELIPHLPEGQLQRALGVVRSLDDSRLRGQALAALFVRTNDRALLREAIEAASAQAEGRAYALLELAERVPVEARGHVIEAALDRATSDDEFGFALGGSLRLAPAELLPKLAGHLSRVTDRWSRLEALTEIGRRAAELDRVTQDAVVAEARATPTRTRTAALAAIAPLLEPAERADLVKLSLRRSRRDPPDLELAPPLLPWWPDDARSALLELWLTSDEVDEYGLEKQLLDSVDPGYVEDLLAWFRPAFKAGTVNATSFAAAAARLSEDGQVRVLAHARAMRQGASRSDMLAGLVEVVRPAALRRALLAARTGRARADWARAISMSAGSLDPSLVPLAVAIVRESPSAAIRLRGLASLAERAEGPQRRALVGEVIGLLATARPTDASMAVFDLGDSLTADEADAVAAIFLDRFALGDETSMVGSLANALSSSSFARFLDHLVPSSGEAATTLVMSRTHPLSAAAYRAALHTAERLPDLGRSARTLGHLLAMPGQAAVGPTPGAVLDMARRSSDDDTITQVIEALAPSLPFEVVHPAARKVADPYLRRMALEAVLPFAPADKVAALQRAVDRLPEGGKGAGGGDEGPGLSESLGGLSPADAGGASTDLLDALAPRPTRALPPPIPPPMTAALPTGADAPAVPTTARAAPGAARARSAGVVSTGFTDLDRPTGALAPDETLAAGRRYLFWFELGEPVAGSIEAAPTRLMVPVGEVRLVVLLYSPDGEVDIGPGRAEFELGPGGTFIAAASPGGGRFPEGGRRVGFEVTMPRRPGKVRLRCSVLAHGVLLQSRLVTAHVTPEPRGRAKALRSVLDYDIAPSLQAASVADRETHALSILLNQAGGSHTFYFAGGGEEPKLVGSADIGPLVIQRLVEEARGALRLASWGADTEWDGKAPYAYEKPGDPDQLRTDLVRFANRGYSLYNTLLEALGYVHEDDLCALLRLPAFVQLAHLADPRLILPVAMVYDRNLDTGQDPADIKLCPGFTKALAAKQELKETSCWNGDCPSAGKDDVVCPSGFWGFRHAIGIPLSFKGREGARRIARSAPLSAVAAVSTDPDFHRWPEHAKVLQGLEPKVDWTIAFDRDDALRSFAASKPQLVYFYCHGGVANTEPYLRVGSPDGPLIFGSTFRNKVEWTDPRPIVLVNGCHTTALGPEVAQPLVSGLMFTANAAGVIGTEVTIFEPLAVAFAEAFLPAFDAGSMLGWAVRDARLTLLGRGNPLGLVYIPFAAADLELA